MHRYKTWNYAAPTTAPPAPVATGTATKTMLQLAPASGRQVEIISWGYLMSVPSASSGGQVELLQTDVAASGLTAAVAGGIYALQPGIPASNLQLGAALTGYAPGTAVTEGTPVTTRSLDNDLIAASSVAAVINYAYQFVPDERPRVAANTFLRVRATMNTSMTMLCWIVWDE
jgi:hypothetical protein